jgi:methionyl-tRNA formyltransferase
VREILPGYLSGRLTPQAQDEALVTWAPKIKKEQGLIEWSRSAREIFCQVRALQPWPGTFTKFESKTLKILEVETVSRDQTLNDNSQPSGSVVEVGKDFVRVACGMGTLKILKVQPESRSAMSVKDFLAGHKIKEGDTL